MNKLSKQEFHHKCLLLLQDLIIYIDGDQIEMFNVNKWNYQKHNKVHL